MYIKKKKGRKGDRAQPGEVLSSRIWVAGRRNLSLGGEHSPGEPAEGMRVSGAAMRGTRPAPSLL